MAAKKKPVQHSMMLHVGSPKWIPARTAWLLTFIDLTSILVGFFVLLFSTQTIDRSSWSDVSGSFKAAFRATPAALATLPSGQNNTDELRVVTVKDALPYLNSLLLQRLKDDVVWSALSGEERVLGEQRELAYVLPDAALGADSAPVLQRLGTILRGWKNPIAVRAVLAPGDDYAMAAKMVVRAAEMLHAAGVKEVSAEVIWGKVGAMELVVMNR